MREGNREAAGVPLKRPHLAEVDFDRAPFIAFWEVTRACALACVHCRAAAQPQRHPQELTTQEGLELIDQIAALGTPLLVLTGGDPMMRPDLGGFIRHGTQRGLRVSLAPSATKLVTKNALNQLKEAGLARISFSVDGSQAHIHDAFRQTPGAFVRAMECLADAREAGLSLQVNTTVSRYNRHDLGNIAERVGDLGAVLWSVFFLVPTGRGQATDMVSPEEHEDIFHWLYDLSQRAPFDIKTTAAEHYRRVVIQRQQREKPQLDPVEIKLTLAAPGFSVQDGIGRASQGVNDGKGCVFISHTGEVCPSGFLPLPGGNVRQRGLAQTYQESAIFRDLRDPTKLKGKCGYCEYNRICGGSRARAYAVSGDSLAQEPCCIYQPQSIHPQAASQSHSVQGGSFP